MLKVLIQATEKQTYAASRWIANMADIGKLLVSEILKFIMLVYKIA